MNLGGDGGALALVGEDGAVVVQHGLYRVLLPQQHRDGGKYLLGIDLGEGVVGKAVVEQGGGAVKAVGGGGGVHHHGDELHAVPLCCGGQAVEGGVGGAGFQPCGPGIGVDEPVGVGQLKCTVPEGVHPDGGVLPQLGVIQNQLPAHEGDVVGGGHVAFGGESGTVAKDGGLHAQLFGPLVHALDKGGLAAGYCLCQSHSTVVGRCHGYRLHHLADGELLPLFQPDLGAAHGAGIGGGGDHVIPAERPGIDGLHHQQQGHHLGHRGGLVDSVGILLKEHLSGAFLHENGGGRGDIHFSGPGMGGQQAQQYQRQGEYGFHGVNPSFPVW